MPDDTSTEERLSPKSVDESSDAGLRTGKDRFTVVFLYCLGACLGPVSFGFSMAYTSTADPTLLNGKLLTLDQVAVFDSLVPIGAIFGGLIGGYLCDRFGRKKAMVMSQIPNLIGWILISAAGSSPYALLASGRVINGFGVGLVSLVVPVYLTELSSTRLRGAFGSLNQLFITIGILLSYGLGKAFDGNQKDWRILAYIGVGITSFFLLIALFVLPESPTWLVRQQKQPIAKRILLRLRGRDYAVDEELISYKNKTDESAPFSWRELGNRKVAKAVSIGMMLMVFQQFCGINAVLFNSSDIFMLAGFKDPRLCSVFIGIGMVFGTFIGVLLMDRAGRRALLVIGGVFMAISLCVLGYCNYTIKDPVKSSGLVWLSLVCLIIYIILFSIGWGPIPWLIMSEVFNSRIKGIGSTLTTITNWILASVVTLTFKYMTQGMTTPGTFWFYTGFCVLSVIYVLLQVPETKGRNIQQIEDLL